MLDTAVPAGRGTSGRRTQRRAEPHNQSELREAFVNGLSTAYNAKARMPIAIHAAATSTRSAIEQGRLRHPVPCLSEALAAASQDGQAIPKIMESVGRSTSMGVCSMGNIRRQ
jgi:hypothetical protein